MPVTERVAGIFIVRAPGRGVKKRPWTGPLCGRWGRGGDYCTGYSVQSPPSCCNRKRLPLCITMELALSET